MDRRTYDDRVYYSSVVSHGNHALIRFDAMNDLIHYRQRAVFVNWTVIELILVVQLVLWHSCIILCIAGFMILYA